MSEAWTPKVVVVGAGAMGSLIGGLLGEGGMAVTLVDVWAEHVAAIEKDGLRLIGDTHDRVVPVRATTEPATIDGADIVIVQCKALHTAAAVEGARGLFGDGTVAISFQNGLGNEEATGGIVGMDKVLGGLTAQGSNVVGPGVIRYYSDLPSYIGELEGGISTRAERVAKAFTSAGLQTTASPDIRREMWKKLLANVATSAISTITDLTLDQVMAMPELKTVAFNALDEAAAVGRAAGIDLDGEAAREILLKITGKGATGRNKSSMCIDVLNRRKSEVDFIYGSVVRLGQEHGVPTPVIETLVAAVKGMESHFA